MSQSTTYIIVNNNCIPEEEGVVPAVNSGLFYGAGCFETFVAENGYIFKFEDHITRMNQGLEYLGANKKERIYSDVVLNQINTLLEKNQLKNKRCRIRVQASLNEKSGYSCHQNHSVILIITCKEVEKKSAPKKLILSKTRVVPSSARPVNLKLSNMLHYRQAFREAEEKEADDALMLTTDGLIAETSIANVFWKTGSIIYTPSVDCDILPGIMRNSIIDIIQRKMKIEVREGSFRVNELLDADQVWLTNSVIDCRPVLSIEKSSFDIDTDFYSVLEQYFQSYKKEHSTCV